MVVISGSHALDFIFYYSLYCKVNLNLGANKVVVVVDIPFSFPGPARPIGTRLAERG